MNVEQHLKVAQFHINSARKHAGDSEFKCGCPAADHQKELDAAVEEVTAESK